MEIDVEKLIIEEHVVYSYACKTCEKATDESKIISPEGPKTIFYPMTTCRNTPTSNKVGDDGSYVPG